MTKRLFVSAACAVAIAWCAVNTMYAQDGQSGPPVPTLPFHLVENFFHYPAYSVIGRLSGVAVGTERQHRGTQSRLPPGPRVQGRRQLRAHMG